MAGTLFDDYRLSELAAIAHELKAPLALITHLAASVADAGYGLTDAQRATAVDRIKLSAERSLRLVQALTLCRRLEGNQGSFLCTLEPLNVTQECARTIDELSPLAVAYGQTITLESPHAGPLVVGNRELLRSIFFNLIDNALQHNPPAGVVSVRVKRRSGVIRICVHDAGPGLSKQEFKTLRRTAGYKPQAFGKRPGSSGLGLFIAGQMVGAMGGKIGLGTVASGADFHVDLLGSEQLSLW